MSNEPLKSAFFIFIAIAALILWKGTPATPLALEIDTPYKVLRNNESSIADSSQLQSNPDKSKSHSDSSSRERANAANAGDSKSFDMDEIYSEDDHIVDHGSIDHDVFEASDNIQAAMEVWNLEKEAFYRDELGLDASSIAPVHDRSVKTGDAINSIVSAFTANPPKITEADYQYAIARLKEEESQFVRTLVGDDKFRKILAFRDKWNAEIESRFGIKFRVVGF